MYHYIIIKDLQIIVSQFICLEFPWNVLFGYVLQAPICDVQSTNVYKLASNIYMQLP